VEADLLDEQGSVLEQASSAFDVLSGWSDFPRYGFLTDFTPGRSDIESTLAGLAKFHLNALQFYDWQYRHHRLLPEETRYIDPLGRELSLETVRRLLDAAHARGMSALAYLAVYAAGLDFWRSHLDWALYDAAGKPFTFFDFLGLMDPTPGRPWAEHLTAECGRVLSGLPFDGLHVDQYGDPKFAWDAHAQPVDLPGAFAGFLQGLKQAYPQSGLLFNAVGNWPVEAVALAPTGAVYIEVWPPDTRYEDLARIVRQARRLSDNKPVLIALYLPADQQANVLLADAVILAAGGTRIELGEDARLLSDPYFPKHEAIPLPLYQALRRYASFAVRYAALVGPRAVEAEHVTVHTLPEVMAFPRKHSPGWLSISLVNMTGLADPSWNLPHPAPQRVEQLELQIDGAGSVSAVWWASPDQAQPALAPAAWRMEGDALFVTLPQLELFAVLAVDLGSHSPDNPEGAHVP
jgi:dextranase